MQMKGKQQEMKKRKDLAFSTLILMGEEEKNEIKKSVQRESSFRN